jgi:hypothetical protein
VSIETESSRRTRQVLAATERVRVIERRRNEVERSDTR